MSKKLVRLRMTTSSTAARAGQVIECQEADAKRLIAAGYAELYKPAEYVMKQEFDDLAARVAALEETAAGKKAKGKEK